MQVNANSSYLFSNSFSASSYSPPPTFAEISQKGEIDQLKDDYSLISQELSPSERKLYTTLIHEENYEAAKGVVTIGFMRAAGIYHDGEGDTLQGASLSDDLTKLYPPDAPEDQNALSALQEYLITNPQAMMISQVSRGNLLDLRI